MENNNNSITDLITNHSKIIDVLRAAIYYGDFASIVYLNQHNEITTHFLSNILAKDIGYFNLRYFEKYIGKISAKTFGSHNDRYTFQTDRILSVSIIKNLKGKESIIKFYLNSEKKYNEKITSENIEERLFNIKCTNISNSIYERNKITLKPLIENSLDFYSKVESELNKYLVFANLNENQLLSLYKYLLDSFNELNKYKLQKEDKFKYEFLFIDKVQALYKKYPEFDKRNHYFEKYEFPKMSNDLWIWYQILGSTKLSYKKIEKYQTLVDRYTDFNKRHFVSALLKIYSKIEMKKFLSVKSVINDMIEIFENHSIQIEITRNMIDEFYEVVFDERKIKLVLIKKKY